MQKREVGNLPSSERKYLANAIDYHRWVYPFLQVISDIPYITDPSKGRQNHNVCQIILPNARPELIGRGEMFTGKHHYDTHQCKKFQLLTPWFQTAVSQPAWLCPLVAQSAMSPPSTNAARSSALIRVCKLSGHCSFWKESHTWGGS